MKKISFLLVAIIATMLCACSSDDGNDGKEEAPKYDCKITVSTSSDEIGLKQILDISYTLSKPATEYYMEDSDGNKVYNQKELEWTPTKLGEQNLKFVASNGSEEVIESKKINVVPCDMGVGRWGNSNAYIKRCENNTLSTNSSGMLRYKIKGGERVYQFNSDKLNRGFDLITYEYSTSTESNLWLCLDLYMQHIDNIKKEFGEPASFSDDIYSFSRNFVNEPGDVMYEAQRIINGTHDIRYVFKSNRTTIECTLSKKPNSSYTWASQVTTTYHQN